MPCSPPGCSFSVPRSFLMVLAFYVARADNPKSTLCVVVQVRLHGGLHELSPSVLAAQVSPWLKKSRMVCTKPCIPAIGGGARDFKPRGTAGAEPLGLRPDVAQGWRRQCRRALLFLATLFASPIHPSTALWRTVAWQDCQSRAAAMPAGACAGRMPRRWSKQHRRQVVRDPVERGPITSPGATCLWCAGLNIRTS